MTRLGCCVSAAVTSGYVSGGGRGDSAVCSPSTWLQPEERAGVKCGIFMLAVSVESSRRELAREDVSLGREEQKHATRHECRVKSAVDVK